jgi:hypothetical protein
MVCTQRPVAFRVPFPPSTAASRETGKQPGENGFPQPKSPKPDAFGKRECSTIVVPSASGVSPLRAPLTCERGNGTHYDPVRPSGRFHLSAPYLFPPSLPFRLFPFAKGETSGHGG